MKREENCPNYFAQTVYNSNVKPSHIYNVNNKDLIIVFSCN